jgi:uncharacterized protein YbgA (DUF1722 family)
MLPAFTIEWIIYELSKWVGFRLAERGIKRLVAGLRNIPKIDEDILTLDRRIRSEVSEEIISAERSISSVMVYASRFGDKQLLESLGYLKSRLERFREDFIDFAKDVVEKKEKAKGLIYLDYILLSGSFAISETAKDLVDLLQERDKVKLESGLDEIRAYVRDLERLAHIRGMALGTSDRKFLRILESRYPNVYEVMRSFAAFAYSSSAKKSLFGRKSYDEICGRAIYVAKVLEERYGPVVRLSDFCNEFLKLNPDLDISSDDLKKSIEILAGKEFIGGIESEGNLKYVILVYDYAGLLRVVRKLIKDEDEGLTLEGLIAETGLPRVYLLKLLERMEEDGTSRKAINYDGTVCWYFPGLLTKEEQTETIQ